MAESGFSAEYYRELVYSHVDNVNLAVRGADARQPNRCMSSSRRKAAKPSADCSSKASSPTATKTLAGSAEGRYTVTETGERFEFGQFRGPVADGGKTSGAEHVVLENYPTARADLRLRLPSQRYFEQEEEVELSPRNFGSLMHKAFENADDEEQIRLAVERMQADGTLSAAEAAALRRMIARALEHPAAREWFAGGWERVRNENETIIPGGASAAASRPRDDPRHAGRGGGELQVRRPRTRTAPPSGARIPRPAAADGLHRNRGVFVVRETGKNRKGGGMT